jgi:archaellin
VALDFVDSTAYTDIYIGCAARPSSLATGEFIIAYNDAPATYVNRLAVRVTATGQLDLLMDNVIKASSSPGVIAINNWYYFEFYVKPRNTGGVMTLKVDGTQVATFSGDTTNDREYINSIKFAGNDVSQTVAPMAFDDIVINDNTGSYNNTYPGMVRLLPIHAEAAGNYVAWDRAGVDLGDDAAQVRNGSFEYSMMQTSSADQKQTFDPEVPDLPAGATITNIVVTARARVQSGSGVIAPMVRAGTTDDVSADQTLVSNWKYYQKAWALNPADSAAWEESDLATLEIGVQS